MDKKLFYKMLEENGIVFTNPKDGETYLKKSIISPVDLESLWNTAIDYAKHSTIKEVTDNHKPATTDLFIKILEDSKVNY